MGANLTKMLNYSLNIGLKNWLKKKISYNNDWGIFVVHYFKIREQKQDLYIFWTVEFLFLKLKVLHIYGVINVFLMCSSLVVVCRYILERNILCIL